VQRTARLRYGVAERLRVVTDPGVTSEDRHQGWCLPEQLSGGEVDGVECSDRLDREGPPDPRQHVLGHGYQIAPADERVERLNRTALLVLGQLTGTDGCHERAVSLGERQERRDSPFARAEGALSRGILFEQRCEQRTRFDVERSPLPSIGIDELGTGTARQLQIRPPRKRVTFLPRESHHALLD